jgi:FtsZ-binding cell division protein ZapB
MANLVKGDIVRISSKDLFEVRSRVKGNHYQGVNLTTGKYLSVKISLETMKYTKALGIKDTYFATDNKKIVKVQNLKGQYATARCHADDKFNLEKGFQVAMDKILGIREIPSLKKEKERLAQENANLQREISELREKSSSLEKIIYLNNNRDIVERVHDILDDIVEGVPLDSVEYLHHLDNFVLSYYAKFFK